MTQSHWLQPRRPGAFGWGSLSCPWPLASLLLLLDPPPVTQSPPPTVPRNMPRTLALENVSPATRLLEKRRQMFEVQEALEQQKQEFNQKVSDKELVACWPLQHPALEGSGRGRERS